jgi:nucleotide-binding universal stress UspA family protein
MFKHILIPLDGSMLAQAVLPAAVFLSEQFQAKITLLHMIEKNAPREIHGQTHLRTAPDAETYLKSIDQQWFTQGQTVDCHVHTSEVDNVAESIVEHAGEFDHDLIIMCSHGRGRALHLMLGSIAQSVIAGGTIPVLIIRPNENPPIFSCNTLLAPLDGVADHEQALPAAKALAKACNAALILAWIIPEFGTLSGQMSITSRFLPGTTSRMLELSVKNAETYLTAHVENLRTEGIQSTGYIRRGNPAAAITDLAQELSVDLIVLATHGKAGMQAFWAGSVTHDVCSQCTKPMLLVPVEKDESQEVE